MQVLPLNGPRSCSALLDDSVDNHHRFRITRARLVSIDNNNNNGKLDFNDEGLLARIVTRVFKSFEEDCLESPYFLFMLRQEVKKWKKSITIKDEKLHIAFEAEQSLKAKLAPVIGMVLTSKQARAQSQELKANILAQLQARLKDLQYA